jgi:hypothetical protein
MTKPNVTHERDKRDIYQPDAKRQSHERRCDDDEHYCTNAITWLLRPRAAGQSREG